MPLYTAIGHQLSEKKIRAVLPDAKDFDWLATDHACDFTAETVQETLPTNFDLFRHTAPHRRRKKMIVCDMDSTILDQETLDDMALVLPHDIQEKIADITLRTMRGEIDFTQSIKIRVSCFGGLSTTIIDKVAANLKYMNGAKSLIATMKKFDAICVLISGGFTDITSIVAQQCGFDYHFANQFEKKAGKLTGRLQGDIIDGNAKARILCDIREKHNIKASDVLAVGDGSNDVAMIKAAGLGVAFHGKPLLKAATPSQINHNDLRALLYLQAYRDTDILGG